MRRVTVGIMGASGYVGGELIGRLAAHDGVELVFLGAFRNAERYVCHHFPHLRNGFDLTQKQFEPISDFKRCDVLISALPQGELPKWVESLSPKVDRILNLSGDYRIQNTSLRQKYYPDTKPLPDSMAAAYVMPEFTKISEAKILNLPGCMAAAALYSVMPLLNEGMTTGALIVDAKTGSSGGGSKTATTHAERCGSLSVHKLMGHRHGAEIEDFISTELSQATPVVMTTTSVDISRGVLVHVHGQLKQGVEKNALRNLYTRYYEPHPFIRFVNIAGTPHGLPTTKAILGTNYCEISCAAEERTGRFTAVAALDNLVKGAAGNAIQLLNKLYDFPMEWGLNGFGVWP